MLLLLFIIHITLSHSFATGQEEKGSWQEEEEEFSVNVCAKINDEIFCAIGE